MKKHTPTKRRTTKKRHTDRIEKWKRSVIRKSHKISPLMERKKQDKDAFSFEMHMKKLFNRIKPLKKEILYVDNNITSSNNAIYYTPKVISGSNIIIYPSKWITTSGTTFLISR